MKILQKFNKQFLPAMLGLAALGMTTSASAATVGVDPATMTNGYMNVFDLPSDGGGFVFGSPWGFADLSAGYTPGVLTLGAAPIDTGDAFWYQNGTGGSGAAGNKQMVASSFAEVPDLFFAPGETVTFNFEVLANTLVSGFSVEAYIIDFNGDFSYNESSVLSVTTAGSYSFDHIISSDPLVNGVSQWGFRVTGPNVWSTDVAAQGNIDIAVAAVPVPAAVWLFGSGLLGLVGVARRRNKV